MTLILHDLKECETSIRFATKAKDKMREAGVEKPSEFALCLGPAEQKEWIIWMMEDPIIKDWYSLSILYGYLDMTEFKFYGMELRRLEHDGMEIVPLNANQA